jgi:hypothetical protein
MGSDPKLTEPRLATHMLVASLIRRANAEGDFATLLAKGNEIAGSILIVGQIKGQNPRLFERFPAMTGGLTWEEIPTQTIDKQGSLSDYLARRRANDPDIWILELDVAFAERLDGLLDLEA